MELNYDFFYANLFTLYICCVILMQKNNITVTYINNRRDDDMKALKKIAVTILSCALVLSTQSINLFADENVEIKQTTAAETFVAEANFPDANFRSALLKENILQTLSHLKFLLMN